jgi:hypothetical protein
MRKVRRCSVDAGIPPTQKEKKTKDTAKDFGGEYTLPQTRSKAQASAPPQFRAQVVCQAQDAPEKEWRGRFTVEESEEDLEKRARNTLGILGSWRRLSF